MLQLPIAKTDEIIIVEWELVTGHHELTFIYGNQFQSPLRWHPWL